MKTLVELDNQLRKCFKINEKIKTMNVNHPYSKDGIVDLLVGFCYTYHNKRSFVVVPTYIPNFEAKRMEADLDKLEYKKFWDDEEFYSEDEAADFIGILRQNYFNLRR